MPAAIAAAVPLPGLVLMQVSLVIPVRNEADSLAMLLDSLAVQTRAPEEIILVEGGSDDETLTQLRAAAARDPRMVILEAGPATPGRGRNLGIAAARHEWIALTDAGTRLEPDWLEQLCATATAQECDLVYGNYEPVTDSFFTCCAALAYVAPKQARGPGRMRGPSTASLLLRKRVWEAAGEFPDLRAAEDLIFFERVEQLGVQPAWCPAATVWWQIPRTLRATYARFARYSQVNAQAGRQRHWHYGLARQYAVAFAIGLAALLHHPSWLLLLAVGFGLRVARTLRRRRGEARVPLWSPAVWSTVALILLTLDLATFVGWARAVRARWAAARANGRCIESARE